MIRIEKIKNTYVPEFACTPGYVDVFYSNPNTYVSFYYTKFKELFLNDFPDDLQIGKLYGLEGISLLQLLSQEPDDTLYETDYETIQAMPEKYRRELLKKYRILISELFECERYPDVVNNLRNKYEIRELIEHDSGPMWGLGVYGISEHIKHFNYNPEKLAIVPVRKARMLRFVMLAKLHEQNLLKDCDWSCGFMENSALNNPATFNPNKDYKIHETKLNQLKTTNQTLFKNFYEAYKNELPKKLDSGMSCDLVSCASDPKWLGKYKFNLSLEPGLQVTTHEGLQNFLTEKTFKGFATGLPTIILGPKNIEAKAKSYGFKFYEKIKYDHLEGEARIDKIIEVLKSDIPIDELYSIAEHNFKLSWDKEYLINLIVSRFKKGQ